MNVITSFSKKRNEQLIRYERAVLRELSINQLKKGFKQILGTIYSQNGMMMDRAIEEGCYDIAIEAYLLGSRYSRIGYYGTPIEEVKTRTFEERQVLAEALQDFIHYWTTLGTDQPKDESLLSRCKQYVDYWWEEGFNKGTMKYKMKLH